MNHERRSICVKLSAAQVDEVVRAAAGGRAPSLATLVSSLLAAPLEGAKAPGDPQAGERAPRFARPLPRDTKDSRLSRSLLRGLSLLSCFGPDGRERGIVEMARELGMSASTAHRYAVTLVELGLLERCPESRRYRLPGT
ncbi:MAG TPA: helix-turn-helix domain-containing protein [Solirubrobacteraceae bacterium]|nr:helix-turn-helix domain-containing protein [Solirubrobacteraceae bacterium]